jgi:hypothetical protein
MAAHESHDLILYGAIGAAGYLAYAYLNQLWPFTTTAPATATAATTSAATTATSASTAAASPSLTITAPVVAAPVPAPLSTAPTILPTGNTYGAGLVSQSPWRMKPGGIAQRQTPAGLWSSSATYAAGTVALYDSGNGALSDYVNLTGQNTPTPPPSDTVNWLPLAQTVPQSTLTTENGGSQ